MRSNRWIRQTHRWLSIFFTAGVILNIVAMRQGEPPMWVGLLALLPLVLLLATGLVLFAAPYVARWRGGRRVAAGGFEAAAPGSR